MCLIRSNFLLTINLFLIILWQLRHSHYHNAPSPKPTHHFLQYNYLYTNYAIQDLSPRRMSLTSQVLFVCSCSLLSSVTILDDNLTCTRLIFFRLPLEMSSQGALVRIALSELCMVTDKSLQRQPWIHAWRFMDTVPLSFGV